MSTILDALKKSEQERKLSKLPTLTDMPAPEEQSRWPLMVIISLLVILVLMIGWFGIRWLLADVPDSGIRPTNIVLNNDTLGGTEASTASPGGSDEIVVNVVSYAKLPEQRFVMINGKMYHENDFIRAGLKVEKINSDSVVLNQRGRRIETRP